MNGVKNKIIGSFVPPAIETVNVVKAVNPVVCSMNGVVNKPHIRLSAVPEELFLADLDGIFVCSRCDLPFADIRDLSLHRQRCGGSPVFTCRVCRAKLRSKRDTVKHLATHQKDMA
jgi:hypothetical protein